MNTLGKILVFLIFIMSVFFMAFSFTVFVTHTSWKEKAEQAANDVRSAQSANQALKAEIANLKKSRKAENAARVTAIALLEARLQSSGQELGDLKEQVLRLRAEENQKGQQVTGALQSLAAERSKVESLRQTVITAEGEREDMFKEVVALKDKLLSLEATRTRLEARTSQLTSSVNQADAVLEAHDLSRTQDISGVPPRRTGEVSSVDGENKYVVMTLGEDDGIQRGHQLDVFRRGRYLGRIEVTKSRKDRAVGRVLDNYRKGAIRSGDSVRTK